MRRRSLGKHARARLLWLLAGFALCQGVLAVVIDGWLDGVRDPEYALKLERLKARIAEAPGRPLVMVLGSSRVAFGVDAHRLSEGGTRRPALVFNFGLMGAGPFLHTVTLRRLRADGIRPDRLCVEIVPTMFAACGSRRMEEGMLDGARLQAGEVMRLLPWYRGPHRLLWGWGKGRVLPADRHQAELRELLPPFRPTEAAPAASAIDSHGWRPLRQTPSEEERRAAAAPVLDVNAPFCAAPTLADGPVRALEDVLSRCRREGIAVTLLLMPEAAPFRALYSAAAREALAELLARLRRDWGVNVVDARTWIEDAAFSDTHHLLADGARRFTERFGREWLWPASGSAGDGGSPPAE